MTITSLEEQVVLRTLFKRVPAPMKRPTRKIITQVAPKPRQKNSKFSSYNNRRLSMLLRLLTHPMRVTWWARIKRKIRKGTGRRRKRMRSSTKARLRQMSRSSSASCAKESSHYTSTSRRISLRGCPSDNSRSFSRRWSETWKPSCHISSI